jgi:DNA polymerase-3 subunit alpha
MEKHLRETYGIMVYQEQVMQIASELAGFSMTDADALRQAMGKKKPEIMAEQRDKFVRGAVASGVKAKVAERVFALMERFAGYGFNKSHAAAYGMVAYQTAYLKANYSVEFMAALLTSEMTNSDKVQVHLDECRAMGIELLPPDVNLSQYRFSVGGAAIRFGLGAVKNVGERAIQSILAARQAGLFTALADFISRVDTQLVNRRVVESLIKAGAFDSLGLPRAHLMTTLDATLERGQRLQRERADGQGSLFDLEASGSPFHSEAPGEPVAAEWDSDQLLAHEKEALGFYLSGHPLQGVWREALALGAVATGELASREDGSRVTVCGLATRIQEVSTKKGDRMAFVTLEDMNGSVELTVFPDALRQGGVHLRRGGPLLVRGRVEGTSSPRKVLVEDVRLLAGGAGRDLAGRACRIRVPAGGDVASLRGLLTACEGHPGPATLYLHLLLDGLEVVLVSRRITVGTDRAMVADVEGMLGPGSVTIEA